LQAAGGKTHRPAPDRADPSTTLDGSSISWDEWPSRPRFAPRIGGGGGSVMARWATLFLAFALLLVSAAPSATAAGKPKKKNLVTIAITAVVETSDDASDV